MPETILNEVSAFTIRELTGLQRSLRLTERALPYPPYSLSGTQRAEFTWYPGSPISTVQVFGASEEATTIRGFWKNRFISEWVPPIFGPVAASVSGGSSPGPIQNTLELAKLVDDIRRAGQLVEVTWLDLVRTGILTNFKQDWLRSQDMEWEITFTWVSQGGEEDRNIDFASREVSLSQITPKFVGDATELAEQSTLLGRLEEFNDEVSDSFEKVISAAQEMEDLTTKLIDGTLGQADAVNRMVGLLHFATAGLDDMKVSIESHVDRVTLGIEDLASITVGVAVAASKHNRDVYRQANKMRWTNARQRAQLAKRTNPELLAVFIAAQNQDLRDVSNIYYGTPDDWRSLLTFNRFASSRLAAGQVVYVPQRVSRSAA